MSERVEPIDVYVLIENVDVGETKSVGAYETLRDAQAAVQVDSAWTDYGDGYWSCGLWSVERVPLHPRPSVCARCGEQAIRMTYLCVNCLCDVLAERDLALDGRPLAAAPMPDRDRAKASPLNPSDK